MVLYLGFRGEGSGYGVFQVGLKIMLVIHQPPTGLREEAVLEAQVSIAQVQFYLWFNAL